MKKAVVSFADGAGNYAKALMRLEQSLRSVSFDGEFKGYRDYAHIGSPFHKGANSAVPYAFKAHSIKKAIEEGARYILWADSVVYATKPIDAIFNHIDRRGYLLFDNVGFTIGDFTSDACLDKWGMTRDEAFNKKMLMACVMGFDILHPIAKSFLEKYIAAGTDGISYVGDWYNDNLQVSIDMRVRGHRHDQSVGSIIAAQMNMDITTAQDTYFSYVSHKGILPIANTVCLWSAGI